MANLTMAIDDEILKKARKIAIENDTSLTGLIRIYLNDLIQKEELKREIAVMELSSLFESSTARIGNRRWHREDLHER